MSEQLGFGIDPHSRGEAVKCMRDAQYRSEEQKANLYGGFARVIDIAFDFIPEAIAKSDRPACASFDDVSTLTRSILHHSIDKAWELVGTTERGRMEKIVIKLRPNLKSSHPGDRLKQGAITGTDTTTRLIGAAAGFMYEQTGGQRIDPEAWRQTSINSWKLVWDRQLLGLRSLGIEPGLSHPLTPATEKPITTTLSDEYHVFDPVSLKISTVVPFDDWKMGEDFAGDAVQHEKTIGCPFSLLGPAPTREIVTFMTNLAFDEKVHLSDPRTSPFMNLAA